ncbi:uncharacterized protein SPSK_05956 [Sporothrix schenckii 1099-18]|uniref:Zn(2)-C6 fungal-type domain-containing protein n=1 Tax=Sporothrix schenckii 1099-18 TaxID=1397361 RepID=A0A0F2MPH5_SPOSC|nr:uncharacterized protein SPSK_05956 [Sporothrix schenckii 1099-18]KJR90071.1 hypothetical protein SPSK_05956 [Sporothrix schenckii 1099-18]
MSSVSSTIGKSSSRTRPAALTACEACRKLKMRCIRPTEQGAGEPCERCRRNKRACTIPETRPLGRRHGATGRYHGLEKAYRRMQTELRKAQMRGEMQGASAVGAATVEAAIEETLQGLPGLPDMVDVSEIPAVRDVSDFTDTTELDVCHVTDVPTITAVPGVPIAPPDTRDRQESGIMADMPIDLVSPIQADPEPDPEPMSNPLALLADASSDAANALVEATGDVEDNTDTSIHSSIGIGRRMLRRPGYVSLGLRLNRDTLEQGLDALFAPKPAARSHANYFKRPQRAPLRDVGPDVDPVDLGLVTMDEAATLFPLYFSRLHPINGILDPLLHTPAFVRARSALLFTWILALTAQFDHGPASAAIAKRLRLHGEKLSHHVHACGLKSVEIVQGYYISLLSANPAATLAEECSWLYTMYAFGLGSELGLDREEESPAPKAAEAMETTHAAESDGELAGRLARNRQRTWLRILLWERANSAARGRMHSFPETDLTLNVDRWWRHPLAHPADKHTCAFILLRRTLADLQRDIRRQASSSHTDAHWVRNLVDTTLQPWREAWLPHDDDVSSDVADAYLLHVFLHGRLWTLSFALHRSISCDPTQLHAIRHDCFEAAVGCCEAAVRDLQALGEPLYCMLAPTWAMISYASVLALSLFPTLYGGSRRGTSSSPGNTGHDNGYAAADTTSADSELLALVGQVALQLERAGTTPSHRYGIAALMGHHLVSILRTRLHTRSQSVEPVQQQPQQLPHPSHQVLQLPMTMALCGYQHQPHPSHQYPQIDIGTADMDSWSGKTTFYDGSHETIAGMTPSAVDSSASVYNPFWTTAVMSTEGDLTGEGFADRFRDMFGPGYGGVF